MITIQLHVPLNYDCGNPAAMLVQDGSPEFGMTTPYYNGEEAFRTAGKFGAGGQSPPLSTPHIAIDPQPSTVSGYSWQGRMIASAQHNFEWGIHLVAPPRDGVAWETLAREPMRLWSFIDSLFIRDRGLVAGSCQKWLTDWEYKKRFMLPGAWKVRLIPRPSAPAFMDHLLAHEYCHVLDHAWLARNIIGPLSDWQDAFLNCQFVANSKFSFRNVDIAGTAETTHRIMEYWQRAIEQSGNLFHRTAAGAHPVIRVERIARANDIRSIGEIDFSVTPALLLQNMGCDTSLAMPHCAPDRVFKIATGRIGGNEPELTYMPRVNFEARRVQYGEQIGEFRALDEREEAADDDFGLAIFD